MAGLTKDVNKLKKILIKSNIYLNNMHCNFVIRYSIGNWIFLPKF